MQQPQYLDEICRDTHGCDLASRTSALDDQRVVTVPLCVKGDDVVAALQRSDGVAFIELLEPDLDGVGGNVDGTNEAYDLALFLGFLLQGVHLRVVLGQLVEKLVAGLAALELLGDQRLHGERGRALHVQAGETGQNGQFARYIQPVQVVSCVRLGVALFLCARHLGAELAAAAGGWLERVEQKRHGAAEDAFDLGHLVARLDKVFERRDDRQARADGRLVEHVAACARPVGGGGEDVFEELEVAAEGLLVGRHDGDALFEEGWVGVGDILVRCVVDEDDLAGCLDQVVLQLWERKGRFGVVCELRLPVGERLVVGVVEGLFGCGQPDEREVVGRRGRLREALREAGELVQEALANAAGAWDVSVWCAWKVSVWCAWKVSVWCA